MHPQIKNNWRPIDTPGFHIAPADAQALRRMVQTYRLDSVLRQLSLEASAEADGRSRQWGKKVETANSVLASLAETVDWTLC